MTPLSRLVLAIVFVGLVGCSTPPKSSDAKVSRPDAERIALAQVSGRTVQTAELERERGRLVWSFDIAIPGSKSIREVLVDAEIGKVVALETETPEQQAAEAAKDAEKASR